MNDIQIITEALVEFRNERDWEQFHNPKDLAIALNIEFYRYQVSFKLFKGNI